MSDVKIILKSIDILLDNIELTEFQKKYYDISDGWTPESAAIRVREIFKIPSGPIKDVVKALEDEGIIVYFYDTNESKFDGLTAYTDKGYPVIFVNSNLPNDRIRFTICHELGHLFLHIPCDVEPWRDVEIEANKFASEFLMPSKDCVADFFDFSFPKLMSLKSYWGISKAAIIRRAKDLEVINQGTYIYMMKELGRRNERKHEPGFVEVDEPNILKEIIGLLRTELEYDNEMMASEMHLNVSDFNGYFDAQEKPRVKVRVLRPAI